MKYSTDELLKILQNAQSYPDDVLQEYVEPVSLSISHALLKLLADKHLSRSDSIRASGLDRVYAYQILDGQKNPSRDKVLCLARGMGATYEEVQLLLKQTAYPLLYPRHKRDSVLIYGFSHNLSVMEINELLYDLKLTLL